MTTTDFMDEANILEKGVGRSILSIVFSKIRWTTRKGEEESKSQNNLMEESRGCENKTWKRSRRFREE